MRSVVALCFLAVLCCTADATILDSKLHQVRKTKIDVESTIQELKRIRENTQKDVELTVTKKWLQSREEYNNYANSVLNTIRKEVEDAKARGKNAEPCYDAALNILRNSDFTACTNAQQCRRNAILSIDNNLSFNDQLITTGHELIDELDKIFPDCYEKNSQLIIKKLYNCITNQLGISKIGVKNLKKNASSARSTAKSASKIVIQQSTDCLNKVYSTARLEVAEARSTATRCLSKV